MSIITITIIAVILVVLLIVVAKFITSCLPKIIIGVIILGGLAYLAYRYFIK